MTMAAMLMTGISGRGCSCSETLMVTPDPMATGGFVRNISKGRGLIANSQVIPSSGVICGSSSRKWE